VALVAAGVLMVVTTLQHPSRETATTIVASEPQLIAAHFCTWLLVLLGLPELYAGHRGGMDDLGLSALHRFFGTYLIAVTPSFGFLPRSWPRIRRQCWNNSMARTRNEGLMRACMQPDCTGTIVDGYCDVCGSPATAAPFIPAEAAASVTSPAPVDEPGLTAVPASTPAPAPVDEEIPTLFDLRWSPETTDSIDIQGSREVEATLRRLIEPAAADLEEGGTAEAEPAAADLEEGGTAEAEPAAADLEEGGTAEAEPAAADLEEGGTAEAEPAAADLEEGGTAEAEPAAADLENADTASAGPQHDDKVKLPAVPAVLSGGRHQRPQLPEQQVLRPEPVQTPAETPAKKRRFGYVALAMTALAALLIGALLFAATRDGGVTAQSAPTVTATSTATVSKPTSAPSNQSTGIGGAEPTIQLEPFADSARPFQAVRVEGTYRSGPNTFLRVQRLEGGQWLAFPLPAKTDNSGRFTTFVELGQPGRYRLRVVDPDSGMTSKTFVLVITG
jgi:hypothetical protein